MKGKELIYSVVLIMCFLSIPWFVTNAEENIEQDIPYTVVWNSPKKSNNNLKNIIIIATGGTIAGKGEKGKSSEYVAGEIDIDSIVQSVDGISDLANIYGIQFMNVDSCDIGLKDLLSLAKRINNILKRDDIDGVVITHGTDTMDETAYFLNLVLKSEKPVVITGSMRPSTATSADGPMNLYQAVALAKSDQAVGRGVLIAFSDGIYGARLVQKENAFRTQAFGGRDFGCIGYIKDDNVHIYTESLKKHTITTEFDISEIDSLPNVAIVYFSLGADPEILDLISDEVDGVIIAGAGNGRFSLSWIDSMKKITDKGVPVVRSSRIGNGVVSYDPTLDNLTHCIVGDNFPPQKARVLLMLALTKTNDFNEIERMFLEY